MKARWQAEKDVILQIQALRTRVEELRVEADRATRTGEWARAAEIDYGEIPTAEAETDALTERLAVLQKDKRFLKEEVEADDIAGVVAEWTGIPVTRLMESERQRLVQLEKHLGARVIGQQQAVVAVSNAVRRARAGLQDPDRPIGSFIFLGPTGVGKTETARALAEFIFDDERAIALHVAFKTAQSICIHHKFSNFISESVSAEAESRDSDAKSVGHHGINASKCAIEASSFCSCDSMRSEMRHFERIDAEHTDADSVIGCICIDARVRCA